MTDQDQVWADTVHHIVSTSAPRHGLDPAVLLDVELDDDGKPVGEGVDFAARLDHLADRDPADETFVGAVEEAVAAHAEPDVARANEGGGSGSSRQYDRDPKGTTTGGRFTAGSAQQSASSSSSPRPIYAPQSKGGGGGKTPTAPAASSKFTTLAPGADNNPEAVAQMQQLLTALGFGNLSSGVYDKQTEDAISAVQQRLGIKPNGKANKSLVNKMLNAFDLSPCIKRSDDSPVLQIERRRSYAGQKYRHGWIPASPLALLSPQDVDDEYGTEIDAVDFGDACRIVARQHGVTIESERGADVAIHSTPSAEDADRWADAIDNRETFTRRQFATEPYEGGMSVRFGDYGQDFDDTEATDVAQGLRDMAYLSEDAAHPPDEVDVPEPDDETPIPDAARAAVDGDELQAYWTRGKGLARWSLSPHPWRKLRSLLRKHPGIHDAEGLASHYFKIAFGIWPGERAGSNPVGPG